MENHGENLLRVMSLHALMYCERLFYLEEVEEIRLADSSVFAGRTLHEELRKIEEEDGEWSSREMASQKLGILGKADCLLRRDGSLIAYEHKRGRPRREGKKAVAWPADAVQVCAYAMLLEEESGRTVPEGRIRYHAENVTVRVPLDEIARQSVLSAIERAKELRGSIKRPPVASNDRLCIHCSLAPVCLPEEERLVSDPEWEPIRLYPEDREKKTIHVTEHGARIGRSGETIKIEGPETGVHSFPVSDVGSIILHGYPQISTQALHFCVASEIPVHWISAGGRYVTGTASQSGAVQRRLRQYRALSDPNICLDLARKVTMAKIEGELRYILRATQKTDRNALGITESIEILRRALSDASHSADLSILRGHEGIAAKAYFATLPKLFRPEVPDAMKFLGRNRRPPKDRFNALLGFGYALLYQAVFQAIISVGLEPALGFMHTPRSSAATLVLDIMEIFRQPVWDMALLGSINRLQWNPDADFSVTQGRVWLSDSGRKKAITLFENRLSETWRHPVVGYSLSYSRLIELETRLLEKEWTGSPGLFARMRLR